MFHSLPVSGIVAETHDAKSIVFDLPPALAQRFAYRSGQFLTVRVECDGGPLERCYSLASAPPCDPAPKVTVKRVRGGRVSNWLHDRVAVGDLLCVKEPEGRFVLDDSDRPLLLFAGGSGVTPVVSILKTALATTARTATLLYASRDRASVIFWDELERLRAAHPGRLRVVHRLDDLHGLLDAATVRSVVAGTTDPSCYVCGPAPFMALVERGALEAGASPERFRIERFTLMPATRGAADATAGEPGDLPEYLEVELRGERHRVPYRAGKTLLEASRDAGLDPPYSCEEGFCGCCAANLLEGRVLMTADDALTADEKRRGMVLACQSRPITRRCAFRFVDG